MIGLPWEQHIAFLDDKTRVRDIIGRVREYVQTMRRPSCGTLLCRRKRNPGLCRPLVRKAPDPKLSR